MKRKGKIITTIASLCLAVALMAFGVYAATQVTMGVTSKVKFEVTDVFVTVSGATYKGHVGGNEDPTVSAGAVANEHVVWTALQDSDLAGAGATAAYAATKTYVTNPTTNVNTPIPTLGGNGSIDAWDAGTYSYSSTEVWFRLELTIQNDSTEDAVYVQVNKLFATIDNTAVGATYSITTASDPATGTEAVVIE